jgi:hypothetical protein
MDRKAYVHTAAFGLKLMAGALAAASVIGCSAADPSDPVVRGEMESVLEPQGVATNGIALDGISINGLAMNGVSLNGLSLDGTGLNGVRLSKLVFWNGTPLGPIHHYPVRRFYRYAAACALAASDSIAVYDFDTAATLIFRGERAIDPAWKYGPVTDSRAEILRKCLQEKVDAAQ